MTDTNALFDMQLATFPGSYFGQAALTTTLDDADEKTANIFQVPEDCDLTGATVYCTAISSPPTYKYTLQSCDGTTGDPSGTVLATTAEFTPSAATTEAHSFTSAYSASAGETLAIVVEYGSGTIGGANDATFVDRQSVVKFIVFPFQLSMDSSGAWSAGDFDAYPAIAVQTDLTAIDISGIYSTGDATEYITTSGHRYAQRIEIPSGENIEIHVDGFRFCGGVENATGADVKVACWNSSGSVLASQVIDTNIQAGRMSTTPWAREYRFSESVTITDGTVFYMGFEHMGGAGVADDLTIGYMKPGGLNGLKSWPGGDAFYASKWAGASWADDNTRRLCLNPIFSSIHGTATGGGASTFAATMGVIG